jgi:hypothetical protein
VKSGAISLVRVNPGDLGPLGNGASWSSGGRANKWHW